MKLEFHTKCCFSKHKKSTHEHHPPFKVVFVYLALLYSSSTAAAEQQQQDEHEHEQEQHEPDA